MPKIKVKINCFQKTPSKNEKIILLKGYIKNIKITDDEINNAKIKNYPTY